MTRAKRKAKLQPDFVKKKPKLGKKLLPSNHTNTNLSTRRIHVPNQTATTNFAELLSRTRHHNPKTRVTTWNTLTNQISDVTIPTSPSALLAAAAPGICDEHPAARAAAHNLLRVLLASLDPRPFQRIVNAMFQAALTHIRSAIRIDAANALVQVHVYMLGTPPFEPLVPMLVEPGKSRTAALSAISALCKQVVSDTSSSKRRDNSASRFWFHQPVTRPRRAGRMDDVPADVRESLVTRVAESVLELLQARKRGVYTACDALAGVVAGAVPDACVVSVKRVLKVWDYAGETYPLVLVALAVGENDMVSEYIRAVLERERYVDKFDCVLRECVEVAEVAEAFGERFHRGVVDADYVFVKRAAVTCVAMLHGPHAGRVISYVPAAINLLKDGDQEIAMSLIAATCHAWRDYSREAGLAEALLGVCVSPIVDEVVNDIIGVALCAGVLTADASVACLGECVRRNRSYVVERYLDALEWLASRPGEHRLKALALARALGRVVGQPVAKNVSRIEAVV